MKKIVRKNRKPAANTRQFGVILEDIDGKFDSVLEGQQGLTKRFDGLEGEFNEFREETRANFKSVFDYLSRIDEELKDIKREIADLKKTFAGRVELERVEALEKRVHVLEAELIKLRKH